MKLKVLLHKAEEGGDWAEVPLAACQVAGGGWRMPTKAAFDLQSYFESKVRHISRYLKYTHGTALRRMRSYGF